MVSKALKVIVYALYLNIACRQQHFEQMPRDRSVSMSIQSR